MIWLWALGVVVVIGAVAVVAVGRGDAMAEVFDDRPDTTVPTGRPLTAEDLREVRFTTALRGYRMDEVDALLARLEADLLNREQRRALDVEAAADGSVAADGPHADAAGAHAADDEAP